MWLNPTVLLVEAQRVLHRGGREGGEGGRRGREGREGGRRGREGGEGGREGREGGEGGREGREGKREEGWKARENGEEDRMEI